MDRTIAPAFQAITDIDLIQPQQVLLKNGCNVFYFNSGEQDMLRIEWIFENVRFDHSKPLLNSATNALLIEGTKKHTAGQIADMIDFYGAFLQPEHSSDFSQLTLYSLNKHLNHTLPIVQDVLFNAAFPQKEIDTYVRNKQQSLQVSLQKDDIVARRIFNKALYGDNTSYGYVVEKEDYQNINQGDLEMQHGQMYCPSNCTIIISGKVDEGVLKVVSEMFGDEWISKATAPDTSQPMVQPDSNKFFFQEKQSALQSSIRLGVPAVNRTHPDFPALQVLNAALGGYFGSRLMANIREDKGYTYGIGSAISSLKYSGVWFIASQVGADVCKSAIVEIEKEIALLKKEPILDDELNLVRNYLLGSLLGSLENVFSHADKFKNIYFSGLDYSYYNRYMEVVQNVSAIELQKLAQQYLDWDNFYKIIVGKY